MENYQLSSQNDIELLEQVVVNGDLAKLSAPQRLDYYRQVCQSMGLNPLSKPFDYINLNGKLTLYAKKDATDQLRKINGVSIDDIKTDDEGDWFVVTVKGSDKTGRRDVEIGAVAKNDMRGNYGNALMKAVTKAKRRLTLSLCGLGWLDETEIETIPDANPVVVDSNGEIVQQKLEAPKTEQKRQFDETEFLKGWQEKSTVLVGDSQLPLEEMSLEFAIDVDTRNSDGTVVKMGNRATAELAGMWRAYKKRLSDPNVIRDDVLMRLSAVNTILTARSKAVANK